MFYCDGTRHLSLLMKQMFHCDGTRHFSTAHKRSGLTDITNHFPSGGSWVLALVFYCDGTRHLIKEVAILTLLHIFRLVVHGFWLLCFIVMVLDIFPCS